MISRCPGEPEPAFVSKSIHAEGWQRRRSRGACSSASRTGSRLRGYEIDEAASGRLVNLCIRRGLQVLVFAGSLCFGGIAAGWAADTSAKHQTSAVALEESYSFGVLPYLAPLRMEAIYAPVGAALSQAIDHPVQLRTASQFELFFERLKAKQYDIALVQPFWYVLAVDRLGYLPLARIEEPLSSVIVVLNDSPLNSIEDLRGKTVAAPPPFGPMTRLASRALTERDIVPGRDVMLRHVRSIDSCFQQVIIGTAAACISGSFPVPAIEERLKVKLRVLMQTPSIPNLTLVIHSRVPADVRARFRQAILSWAGSDEGRTLLRGIKTRGFVPVHDADYDGVRALMKETQQP